MIYLDSAATSFLKPAEVEQAVVQALHTMGNAGRGAHAPTLNASRMIYETRERLAELFHCSDPSRISFTGNVTEALNMAIHGVLRPGDHAITTVCEHNSVLRPLYRKREKGVELTILQADAKGQIDYADFQRNCRTNTRAVVIHHGSNLTGNVMDLKKISEFTRSRGIVLIVDAAQTAGAIPIDVEHMGIDILCFTGHKSLLGPQGTGGIYVREGILLPPLKVGGSGIHSFQETHPDKMPEALEAGTLNIHGIAGLCGALSFIKKTGVENIRKREDALTRQFYQGVRAIPGIHVYGNPEAPLRTPIISVNLGAMDSARVSDILWEDYEICVRAGAHCAPLMHAAFHTVEQGAVRFSFSYFNTEEEVTEAIRALEEIAQFYKEQGMDVNA